MVPYTLTIMLCSKQFPHSKSKIERYKREICNSISDVIEKCKERYEGKKKSKNEIEEKVECE